MKNLQSICSGPVFSPLEFSGLEIIALHTCPELTTIFNPALLRNRVCLKELIVENCPKVESLVSGDLSGLEADYSYILPSLRKILFVDLPGLVSISSGLRIGTKLESIVFSNCPMLKNLSPMDIMYSKYMHEIKDDESEWFNEMETTNREIAYLRQFGPLTSIYDDLKEQTKSSGKAPFQDQNNVVNLKVDDDKPKQGARKSSSLIKGARNEIVNRGHGR